MKKFYKIILGIIVTVFVLTSFIACSFDESRNHLSGGQLLDDEKMSQIKNEILNDEMSETKTTENVGTNVDDSSLTSDKNDEASEKNGDGEISNETLSEPINDNSNENTNENKSTVYWTTSGKVWHTTSGCRYLKNSKDVLHGSIDEAKEAGKTKACSACGK